MNKCPKNEEFIVKAEDDSARTCLASIWFTIPTGRGERLKPVSVSVRIRSELPVYVHCADTIILHHFCAVRAV